MEVGIIRSIITDQIILPKINEKSEPITFADAILLASLQGNSRNQDMFIGTEDS